jgi:hypothetical protein
MLLLQTKPCMVLPCAHTSQAWPSDMKTGATVLRSLLFCA